jgi:hypothetical protein
MVETDRRAVHFFGAPSPMPSELWSRLTKAGFLDSIEAESKPARAGFARSLSAPSVSLRQ